MTDLTPLRELADKWQEAADVARGEGCDPELIDTMDEFVAELRSTIATIESANPWIPVEKGLPGAGLWDVRVWVEGHELAEYVYACTVDDTGWLTRIAGMRIGVVAHDMRSRRVTHYRHHVPEKGPSE